MSKNLPVDYSSVNNVLFKYDGEREINKYTVVLYTSNKVHQFHTDNIDELRNIISPIEIIEESTYDLFLSTCYKLIRQMNPGIVLAMGIEIKEKPMNVFFIKNETSIKIEDESISSLINRVLDYAKSVHKSQ